ncbi:hypothetical protein M407DRAFT_31706 [Tulasnella calospora MUT 4182]|uniref:Uncharacterized protein n=1 Tax=Tulasnella calospora MUT 4182 TaxID=1051891 RepID=A0A0C3PUS8_9AGAM|nr:hypothetical protein M407DRAFT_31706 [Tulasnella calospora MUT 4182]
MTNFRPSAHQALQKAFKRGRLQKVGSKYRLNPNWSGGSTSRRTTRRPQAAGGAPPPAIPFSARVPGISGSWPVATPTQGLPPGQAHPDGVLQPTAVGLPASTGPSTFHHHPSFPNPHPAENPSNPHNAPTAPIPSVIPAASALLQAIAGINGIIDRSQSEVSHPEGGGDMEVPDRESDPEPEPDPNVNGIVAMDEGDDDAEGETVEGRSSREATEGRDGSSPDRQQTVNGLDNSRERFSTTNQRQSSDDPEEELRSALFQLVDQLRAAAAASAHA